VLVPEMNLGQLSRLLRASTWSTPAGQKVKGVPFTAGELEQRYWRPR
jgi:hypothetical protein